MEKRITAGTSFLETNQDPIVLEGEGLHATSPAAKLLEAAIIAVDGDTGGSFTSSALRAVIGKANQFGYKVTRVEENLPAVTAKVTLERI